MAKGGGGNDDRAKVKLRVIEFELEGGNASVENSIRQIVHSLGARTNGPSGRQLPTKQQSVLPPSASEDAVEEHAQDADYVEAEASAAETAAPSKPRPARRPTVPDPIEVDLTSGPVAFQQFCDERGITASSSDSKKYLVSAAWMKEHRQTPAIETGHIYSIFRMMKWNLPADIGAPLRAMKQQKWFTTPERGKFAINHLGENEVNSLTA